MQTYVAFLRGVNVGGKSLVKMSELADALGESGLQDVRTYIQSGNIIFRSAQTSADKLAAHISDVILQTFALPVATAVFSSADWQQVVAEAPKWWGTDVSRKHNILIVIRPCTVQEVVVATGTLKPDIEAMEPGKGVLYQALSLEDFGKTAGGKLAASPIYKQLTIRNYNTATKLAALLKDTETEAHQA
jgi:uncharacterized protein (DUF1697 family)